MKNIPVFCAIIGFSQFFMLVNPHGSIVGDGTGLDVVHLVKYLNKCQLVILMSRGQGGMEIYKYRNTVCTYVIKSCQQPWEAWKVLWTLSNTLGSQVRSCCVLCFCLWFLQRPISFVTAYIGNVIFGAKNWQPSVKVKSNNHVILNVRAQCQSGSTILKNQSV